MILLGMTSASDPLPSDLAAAHAMILAERAAAMATLIQTAKLNDLDPLAWLADVLARIAETPQNRLHELLPWSWNVHAQSIAPPQAA